MRYVDNVIYILSCALAFTFILDDSELFVVFYDEQIQHGLTGSHPHLPRLTCLDKFSPVSLDASEGVQLLCLIDKAADACRYLQTYGEWNRAAWLAKVTRRDAVHHWETAK